MIRAIIVDDERKARETLNKLIKDYCGNVEIIAKVNSVDTAYDAIVEYKPQLVFLDVEMPGSNGFDLLERFDKVDFDVIFTTAYGHYAVKAIKFAALYYLLKPIEIHELKEAIFQVEQKLTNRSLMDDRVMALLSNLQGAQFQKVAIPDVEGVTFVDVNQICRCQADRNYSIIYLSDGTNITSTRTLKEYESLFSNHHFFRVHHSHLINLSFVKRYIKGDGGFVIMNDKSKVEVSRRRKNEFLEKLAEM